MDFWQIAGYFGGPIAGGIVAWFVGRAGVASKFQETVKSLGTSFEALKSGLQLAHEHHKSTVEDKFRVVEDKIRELKQEIDEYRDSSTDFAKDAELSRFMVEVNNRWNEISMLLGEIKGQLMYRRPTPPGT